MLRNLSILVNLISHFNQELNQTLLFHYKPQKPPKFFFSFPLGNIHTFHLFRQSSVGKQPILCLPRTSPCLELTTSILKKLKFLSKPIMELIILHSETYFIFLPLSLISVSQQSPLTPIKSYTHYNYTESHYDSLNQKLTIVPNLLHLNLALLDLTFSTKMLTFGD